jgi:hypothetical protein
MDFATTALAMWDITRTSLRVVLGITFFTSYLLRIIGNFIDKLFPIVEISNSEILSAMIIID